MSSWVIASRHDKTKGAGSYESFISGTDNMNFSGSTRKAPLRQTEIQLQILGL